MRLTVQLSLAFFIVAILMMPVIHSVGPSPIGRSPEPGTWKGLKTYQGSNLMHLEAGWNLIGFPAEYPKIKKASDICHAEYYDYAFDDFNVWIVVYFNETQNKYYSYVENDAAKFDFPIKSGEAYYIWAHRPCYIYLGDGFLLPRLEVNLIRGWNMVSLYGTFSWMTKYIYTYTTDFDWTKEDGFSWYEKKMTATTLIPHVKNMDGTNYSGGLLIFVRSYGGGEYTAYVIGDDPKWDFVLNEFVGLYVWVETPSKMIWNIDWWE